MRPVQAAGSVQLVSHRAPEQQYEPVALRGELLGEDPLRAQALGPLELAGLLDPDPLTAGHVDGYAVPLGLRDRLVPSRRPGDLGAVEVEREPAAAARGRPVDRHQPVDVLRREAGEHDSRRRAETLDALLLDVALGHARAAAPDARAFQPRRFPLDDPAGGGAGCADVCGLGFVRRRRYDNAVITGRLAI